MGTFDVPFPPARLTGALLLALAAPLSAAPAAVNSDVTISESFGKKFALEKPPVTFEFPLEEFLPPSEAAGPGASPAGNDVQANKMLLEALGYPEARHLAKPWLPDIPGTDTAEFGLELPRKQEIRDWELSIFDPRGRSVNTMSGSGSPPAKVRWNLKTTAGSPIQVGVPYTYRFQFTDRHGKRRSFLGKGFELPALQYLDADKNKVIEIAATALFTPKKAELDPDGEGLLLRAFEAVSAGKSPFCRLKLQDDVPSPLLQRRLQFLRQLITRELPSQEGKAAVEGGVPDSRGAVLQISGF